MACMSQAIPGVPPLYGACASGKESAGDGQGVEQAAGREEPCHVDAGHQHAGSQRTPSASTLPPSSAEVGPGQVGGAAVQTKSL